MKKMTENKTKLVSARVTEAEYNVLKKKADEQGVTISQVIIGATVKSNTISALMTRNTVSLIKSISAECKELRADYNLLRSSCKAENLENCIKRIDSIEMEMDELWQSLR